MTAAVRQRARKQPAEVRREEVLDAAVRVFARDSYRAAGTAEIAREAGIAEPTIYRHFSSKRDLYIAALERCCEVVKSAFARIAGEHENALEAMVGMARWYDVSIAENPSYIQLRQRAEAEAADDDVREQVSGAYLSIAALVTDVIRRGQQQGVFKPHLSANGVAWLFMGLGQIADTMQLLGMEPVDCNEQFQEMGGLFWELVINPDHAGAVAFAREQLGS